MAMTLPHFFSFSLTDCFTNTPDDERGSLSTFLFLSVSDTSQADFFLKRPGILFFSKGCTLASSVLID